MSNVLLDTDLMGKVLFDTLLRNDNYNARTYGRIGSVCFTWRHLQQQNLACLYHVLGRSSPSVWTRALLFPHEETFGYPSSSDMRSPVHGRKKQKGRALTQHEERALRQREVTQTQRALESVWDVGGWGDGLLARRSDVWKSEVVSLTH